MTLECVRGETPAWDIVCTRDSLPVDLTGARLNFAAKSALVDASPVIEHDTVEGGILISDAAAGKCVLTFDAADTTQFEGAFAQRLFWDMKLVELDGTITVVAAGELFVSPNVAA
jgi:hypothetical protein